MDEDKEWTDEDKEWWEKFRRSVPKIIEIKGDPKELVRQLVVIRAKAILNESCDMCVHPTDLSTELCSECIDEPVPKHKISAEVPRKDREPRMRLLDVYAPNQTNWKKHFKLKEEWRDWLKGPFADEVAEEDQDMARKLREMAAEL